MAPREILDSEDDDDDFEDQDYGDTLMPIAGGAAPEAESVPEQQATAAPPLPSAINNVTNTSTLSTNPSFFEQVYEGQHIACDELLPAPTGDGIDTQITPMPPSTRKASRAEASAKKQAKSNDVVDLTTPQKPADASVWDFPGSSLPPTADPGPAAAAAAPSSVRSTPFVRKRTQVARTQDEDPYVFPSSTPARSSKRTRRSLSAAAESSPVALVPNATAPGMYVAQSELTPSQKERYATLSLPNSSASEFGVPQPTLPLQVEGTEVHKSSGVTLMTIMYTTPSRIGSSSGREVPFTGGASGENVTLAGYQSSPDVLNDMAPPSTSSNKRKARSKTDMDPPTSTALGHKTKRRRTIQDDDEDGDFGAENANSYVPDEVSDEPIPVPEPQQEAKPQPKKKRGRKKKEPIPQPEEPVLEVGPREVYQPDTSVSISDGRDAPVSDVLEPEAVPEIVEPAPGPEPAVEEQPPPAKKKRARPMKADTAAKAQPVAIDIEGEAVEEHREPLAEVPANTQPKGKKTPAAKGKGGRKKKEVVVDSDEESDDGEEVNEKHNKPVPGKEVVKEVVIETKPEVKNVKDEKTAVGATPIKPAGYRVGLSKRSRIAPLLKSLKKA